MRGQQRAFTLIEILMVVVILGVVAALVIVQVNTAQMQTKSSAQLADVKRVQNAIAYFQAQQSIWPTQSGSVPDVIDWDKLVHVTTSSSGERYGPYINNPPSVPEPGLVGTLDGLGNFHWSAGS